MLNFIPYQGPKDDIVYQLKCILKSLFKNYI